MAKSWIILVCFYLFAVWGRFLLLFRIGSWVPTACSNWPLEMMLLFDCDDDCPDGIWFGDNDSSMILVVLSASWAFSFGSNCNISSNSTCSTLSLSRLDVLALILALSYYSLFCLLSLFLIWSFLTSVSSPSWASNSVSSSSTVYGCCWLIWPCWFISEVILDRIS